MLESGLIYKMISAVVQSMALISQGFCLEMLLTGRAERGSRKVRIISWTAWGSIFVMIKCMFTMPPLYYGVLHPTILLVIHIFLLLYFYSDRLWVRFAHTVLLILQDVLAEVLLYYTLGQVENLNFSKADFANPYMAERCVMVAALSIFMNIIYTVVVLKFSKKREHEVNLLWIVGMLQLLCGFMVMAVTKWGKIGENSYIQYMVYISGVVVFEFGMLLFFFSQAEKKEIKEKVRRLQLETELKRAHYEQVEVQRQELERLRRGYRESLLSIQEMLEGGRMAEAETLISDLSVRISATKEYPFCAVPVVNAILTEKQQLCMEEGISFKVNLMLPDTTGIAELDLCIVFGNLADNAIRACKEVKTNGKESRITLNSGIVRGYLVIKCKNTALENRKNKVWGTGYGHKILADIAKKYEGDFQTLYENECFLAQISLRLRN